MAKRYFSRLIVLFLVISLFSTSFHSLVKADESQTMPAEDNTSLPYSGEMTAKPDGYTILSITSNSLVIEIQGPSYDLSTSSIDGGSCLDLKADGYFQNGKPGEPGLLSAGMMLGIPLSGSPSLIIQDIDIIEIPGKNSLCPVPTPKFQPNPDQLMDFHGYQSIEDPDIYSQDQFLPFDAIEITPTGMIRSQKVARLIFTPFQYNPAIGELRYISRIRVEILFRNSITNEIATRANSEELFETLLKQILINYEQARQWRMSRLPAPLATDQSSRNVIADNPAYKIQVDQDGFYKISYDELDQAGIPVDNIDPRTFRISNQAIEIPELVIGEEDGVFNPSDYILFYGQETNTKYTDINTYWLEWGNGYGLRMGTIDGAVNGAEIPTAFLTTDHFEYDLRYMNVAPSGPQNDHWYWYLLNANGTPVSHDFTVSLKNINSSPDTVIISGLLKGYYANPEHHTLIYLNGNLIDDHHWPSTAEYTFSVEVDRSFLHEGDNTLRVECPLDGGITVDQLLVNWFEINYSHTFVADDDFLGFDWNQLGTWQFQVSGFSNEFIGVFDITDPSAPSQIIGGDIVPAGSLYQINFEQQINTSLHYLTISNSDWLTPIRIFQDNPSVLKNPANGADYIIISHADFLSALQPLVNFRTQQNLRVLLVDVQDIYDEFNGGVFDPQAIQDFLAYAYANWVSPAPAYVLLVGDGHYDYKNNFGDSGIERIPPFLGEFDPWIGETASDNRYVTVSGDDVLPDMFVGRLPTNSVDETTIMVNKILSYEQDPVQNGWIYDLTFVADNADAGGNFPALSDYLVDNFLPEQYNPEKIYYGSDPYTSVPETRAAIISNINQGRLIITFTGHGSVQTWAAENLFSVNTIGSLSNSGIYPFFLPLTCAEGYFIYPLAQGYNYPSIGESLVRADSKGAIASWSPSGFGLSNGHEILAEALFQAFFDDGLVQFGSATTYAKYYLYNNAPGYNDLIDTYNLFGDPAIRLKTHPTGVTLANFTGETLSGRVLLTWETLNEVWLVGFNLYRSDTIGGEKQRLNPDLILAEKPGQMQGAIYQYEDSTAPGKTYYYWLELVQIGGNEFTDPVQVGGVYWSLLPMVVH